MQVKRKDKPVCVAQVKLKRGQTQLCTQTKEIMIGKWRETRGDLFIDQHYKYEIGV